jgi:hypothetical protein
LEYHLFQAHVVFPEQQVCPIIYPRVEDAL